MKRYILLLAILATALSSAQEIIVIGQKRPPMFVSLNYSGPAINYFGIGFEVGSFQSDGITDILNFNYGTTENRGHNGMGFSIDAGARQYFVMNQNYARLYMENLFTYSRTEFSDANYSGVYEYVSFINPSLGYKIAIGDHFTIDPSAGFNWRIEIMSRGDVNNKDFSNFVGKVGVKLGYRF